MVSASSRYRVDGHISSQTSGFKAHSWMHMETKQIICFLIIFVLLAVTWFTGRQYSSSNPQERWHSSNSEVHQTSCQANKQSITQIKDSKHLMVSAFKDHRENEATRIISIFKRDEHKQLFCIFYCAKNYQRATEAKIDMHSDHFGFPFVTTDVLCEDIPGCNASHVTLQLTQEEVQCEDFLPIWNQKKREEAFPYNFTVCISNLFGEYNNVLQFVQTVEVYRLLGIQKVVIYNTSCGPDLEKVLNFYMKEGILEVVPWPINRFLNPSSGWNFQQHKGDLHYYGQLTTLNECIYRNMYKSRYVLLNDIDEIIAPYQHANLPLLLESLQHNHPHVGVFVIENHIFPKTLFDQSGQFNRTEWKQVPGINILEHIYREPDRKNVYNPTKMIISPRHVVQTSVHSVLKNYGETYRVPPDVCRIVHVRVPLQGHLTKEQLFVDKKLWEYEKNLIPNVDNVLKKSGILN
ncbi:glycosyltransferase family 92 protein [Megalops cyprinoides]|uniref:glycosyltransferase family 92 protein n=1 Tax=Megalops cyprinoides TaxID=118141 RepID=UPI0018645005|nr:glycosyltransferase family 92 protein [Megalops cyprinoides]